MTRGVRPAQLSQSLAMKNKIINGCMRLWQRGTSATGITGSVSSRIADRWGLALNVAGATLRQDQSSTVPDSNTLYSLSVQTTTADAVAPVTAELVTCYQAVEGYNLLPLVGNTCALSFWVRSSKVGTYCVALRNTGYDRSYVAEYTVNVANTWEKKVISIPMNYSGGTWNYTNGVGLYLNFALVVGSTWLTATTNAWQTGNYMTTANQVNFGDNTANNFYLANVQLEQGSASAFEVRDFSTELSLCQRYFQIFGGANNALYYLDYYVTNTGSFGTSFTLPVTMRAIPVPTKNGTWSVYSCAQPSVYCYTPSDFRIMSSSTASSTFNGWLCDSADDTVTFDAEL